MQGVQPDRPMSPRAGSQSMPSPKAPKEKAKLPYSGYKLDGPGLRQCSYIENSASKKKCALSKGIEDVTDFKSLPTPIGLFEDECAFCHSFRTSVIHGPLVCYLRGRIVSRDQGAPSNGIYVHRNCLEWAPRIWYDEGDNVKNLESEIRRASRLRCRRCGLRGAALGCYYNLCNKSFHVPCAVQIDGCRWDDDNKYVLCPEHVSKTLPCDKLSSATKERHQFSSLPQPQRQCLHKEETLQEVQQADQLNPRSSSSPLGQYSEKFLIMDDDQVENQQSDQIKASNWSLVPQSHSSHNEAFSTHSPREDQIIGLTASNSSSLDTSCYPVEKGTPNACQDEEMKVDQQETSSNNSDKWVLLGSSLSASEKGTLEDFACWTGSMVTNEWGENVTHVVVGKNAGSAWHSHRAYEVLMAILSGKWVVHVKWIVDWLEMRPAFEDPYEVTFNNDPNKPLDGPKKGRTRAAEGAQKLFSGLHFYLSDYMTLGNRGRMRNLIGAAGGLVLERSGSLHWPEDSSPRPYFVYHGGVPGKFRASTLRMEMDEVREHAAAGARVISHLTVMDAVAAYDAEVLEQRRR